MYGTCCFSHPPSNVHQQCRLGEFLPSLSIANGGLSSRAQLRAMMRASLVVPQLFHTNAWPLQETTIDSWLTVLSQWYSSIRCKAVVALIYSKLQLTGRSSQKVHIITTYICTAVPDMTWVLSHKLWCMQCRLITCATDKEYNNDLYNKSAGFWSHKSDLAWHPVKGYGYIHCTLL